MFLFRQILNSRVRIIKHIQYNFTNKQYLYNQIFHIQHSNFSLSRRILLETKDKITQDNDLSKETKKQELAHIKPKMYLSFLCKKCNTKNNKIISKHAYENGVVIVRCEGCKNNHLIADNLGWFTDNKDGRNIEHILKKKGENVRRIRNDTDGYFEAVVDEFVTPKVKDEIEHKENKKYLNQEHEKMECSKN